MLADSADSIIQAFGKNKTQTRKIHINLKIPRHKGEIDEKTQKSAPHKVPAEQFMRCTTLKKLKICRIFAEVCIIQRGK